MKQITKTISHAALFFTLLFSSLAANAYDWSSWRHLMTNGAADLEYRYMYRGEVTEVQWRVINNSYSDIYAAVRDKDYRFRDGGSTSKSDEGSNVRGGTTYTFQPDIIRGNVISASAYLDVK